MKSIEKSQDSKKGNQLPKREFDMIDPKFPALN